MVSVSDVLASGDPVIHAAMKLESLASLSDSRVVEDTILTNTFISNYFPKDPSSTCVYFLPVY